MGHPLLQGKRNGKIYISMVDKEASLKLKTIVAPEIIVETEFKKIKNIKLLKDYLTPRKKLVIAERVEFFEAKQLDGWTFMMEPSSKSYLKQTLLGS